jgi:uncharacterized protein (DUF2235 family)
MRRNVVVCCDGTNNEFGEQNTNVVRVVQSLVQGSDQQVVYYDPGIGTMPDPRLITRIGQRVSEAIDLGFATGFTRKVEAAYIYLMNTCKPDDRLFLFGFSRGAYTVRVLAGMLHRLGLLPRGEENFVPYVMRLFAGPKRDEKYNAICDDFRHTFSRPAFDGDVQHRFPVHFLGVWDTVSSVGWVWNPVNYPNTKTNPSIAHIRHAVSVDEHRTSFRQNLMQPGTPGQDLVQLWFPGVHSDVGGGYPEKEGWLWRGAFDWMLDEATKEEIGLMVDSKRRENVAPPLRSDQRPWMDEQHESLKGPWKIAEYFPKKHFDGKVDGKDTFSLKRNLFEHRTIDTGQLMHAWTLRRIRDKAGYAPPNMTPAFLERVRALTEVPPSMPYTP